jgi:hypothetical protein
MSSDFELRWDERPPGARPAIEGPRFPGLIGRHVALRPVTAADYAMLQMLETGGEVGARWRFRGQTPSPEAWVGNLWNGVLTQFLVQSRSEEGPIGLVVGYRASFQDRHLYLAATRFDLRRPTPLMMLGVALFLRHVFDTWAFRTVYMEVPEYNLDQIASGSGRYFSEQARLPGYYEQGGRTWDHVILALTRDVFEQRIRSAADFETRPDSAVTQVRIRNPQARTPTI